VSDKLIGEIFDGFEIERILGKGGMGVVYKAHETNLQRVVAIKVLPDHLSENKSFIARFYREARAVAALNHPNVVTVHRVGEALGCHYIAMEYVKGQELFDLLKEDGPLPVKDALEYVRQTASALHGAHSIGILHRDIKPQNIMIDDSGRVKVMDFGIAKVLTPDAESTALTMDGTLLGTPTHMPPEQCEGGEVDQRGDVYSLGVVLFQTLTGELPFKGETPLAIIQKILNDPLPDLASIRSDVPKAVVHVVQKACAKDREERYETAKEFEQDLAACLRALEKGSEIDETLVKARATGKLKTRSASPGIIALGVAALVLIGVGVFFMRPNSEPERPELASLPGMGSPVETPVAGEGAPGARDPMKEAQPTPALPTPTPMPTPTPTPTPIPNRAPKAEVIMTADRAMEGNPFVIQFKATDPDEDALEMAYRLKGSGFWQMVRSAKVTRMDFPVGNHVLEFRVQDSAGARVVVEKPFAITPRPTPTPAPTTAPIPVVVQEEAAGEIALLEGDNGGTIMGLAISPDGKLLVSGSSSGKLKFWNPEDHTLIEEVEGHFAAIDDVAFSTDGSRLISSDKKAEVLVWDVAKKEVIGRFQGHHSPVLAVGFAPDGKHGVSADNAGNLFLWSLETMDIIKRTDMGTVTCVDFAGKEPLAVSGSQEQQLNVWDYVAGQKVKVLSGGLYRTTMAVAMNDKGDFVLSGGQDKTLRLWQVKSGQVTRAMEGHDNWIQAVAFIEGEDRIISGGRDNTVRVWDQRRGRELHLFDGHTRSVLSLSGHSGKLIGSGSLDQTVRLWQIR